VEKVKYSNAEEVKEVRSESEMGDSAGEMKRRNSTLLRCPVPVSSSRAEI